MKFSLKLPPIVSPRRLREAGVLGMNQRNHAYIMRYNRRADYPDVDDKLRTNKPNIYAIGDIVRGPMLAHKAEDEGYMVAEEIKTGHGHVNYDVIPGVVYTEPEIAMVGKTEAQLKKENVEYTKCTFPLQANSRARAYDAPDGLIKVLADKKTSRFGMVG